MPCGEGAGIARGLREADHHERDRGQRDRRDVVDEQRGIGHDHRRQPARHVADERHAPVRQVQQPGREQPADDQDERARDPGGDAAQTEHGHERDHTDHRRRGVQLCERAEPRHELLRRGVAGRTGAGDLRQLADHDVDRGTEQEPRHHGAREELRDPAHPRHGEQDEHQAGHERDPGDERRHVAADDTGGQDGARCDRRESGAGAGGDLLAGAEDRVEDRAGRRGVEAVLQRDPRDACVPEVLRDDQRGDGDPRRNVGAQPRAVVGAQRADDRDVVRPAPSGSRRHAHPRPSACTVTCGFVATVTPRASPERDRSRTRSRSAPRIRTWTARLQRPACCRYTRADRRAEPPEASLPGCRDRISPPCPGRVPCTGMMGAWPPTPNAHPEPG